MKARCEQCDCVPHAPRRRCPDCDKLVCVSNCWDHRTMRCKSCSDSIGFSGSVRSCGRPAPIESEHSLKQREMGERVVQERLKQREAPEQVEREKAERLRIASTARDSLVSANRAKAEQLRNKWRIIEQESSTKREDKRLVPEQPRPKRAVDSESERIARLRGKWKQFFPEPGR